MILTPDLTIWEHLDQFNNTEFDIDEAYDEVQKDKMEDYFPLFWEHPAVEGITFWGYVEGETWQPKANLLDSRGAPRPALDWIKT